MKTDCLVDAGFFYMYSTSRFPFLVHLSRKGCGNGIFSC